MIVLTQRPFIEEELDGEEETYSVYEKQCTICKKKRVHSIQHFVPVSTDYDTKEHRLSNICKSCYEKKKGKILRAPVNTPKEKEIIPRLFTGVNGRTIVKLPIRPVREISQIPPYDYYKKVFDIRPLGKCKLCEVVFEDMLGNFYRQTGNEAFSTICIGCTKLKRKLNKEKTDLGRKRRRGRLSSYLPTPAKRTGPNIYSRAHIEAELARVRLTRTGLTGISRPGTKRTVIEINE